MLLRVDVEKVRLGVGCEGSEGEKGQQFKRRHRRPTGPKRASDPAPKKGKWRRLYMVNAITRHGLVAPLKSGKGPDPGQDDYDTAKAKTKLRQVKRDRTNHLTAGWIFYAKDSTAIAKNDCDYHDNMDGDMYIHWVEHMLIPAFMAS